LIAVGCVFARVFVVGLGRAARSRSCFVLVPLAGWLVVVVAVGWLVVAVVVAAVVVARDHAVARSVCYLQELLRGFGPCPAKRAR